MEQQQLMQEGKDMSDVEERVARIKETIDKIRKDPKAMKEIDQLIADHT